MVYKSRENAFSVNPANILDDDDDNDDDDDDDDEDDDDYYYHYLHYI